ncbi:hypothetical protein Q763_05510 [Flavobacterium beibuense F44-8]|uniref:DUF6438 domain-containing protein n=2 Tax=Flavobacterium beibuense TaxID=657326 RepID=A0A0A2LQG8_9FLAO|nr:hypothetical protein Q763_05510 [Flavobacterium beibuense F44-8]
MILGSWSSIDNTNQFANKRGFEFFPDSIFEDKYGFFSDRFYYSDSVNDPYNRYFRYFGTKSKYALSKDSLRLFNPAIQKWSSYKVEKLTPDTLIITTNVKDERGGTFIKKTYKTDTIPDFDAIYFYSSPCYGSCPVVSLLIKNNGDILYIGGANVKNKGLYQSNIGKEAFNRIQEKFKRADYMNLEDAYSAKVTDVSSVDIYFIKDNKVVKTIEDYGADGPNELVWAYFPLELIEQELDLKKLEIPDDIAKEFNIDKDYKDIVFYVGERMGFDFLIRLSDNI